MRRKAIAFDRTILNHFYGLEDIEHDEYSTYVDDHVDLNEIVHLQTGYSVEDVQRGGHIGQDEHIN